MFERRKQGAVDVINFDGPLTKDYVDEAADMIQQCLQNGQPMAVANMQGTQLIDSAGLELLLESHEQFETRGGSFQLAAPNRLCRDILIATGVADRFEIHAEVKSAVRRFLQ